MIGIKRGAGLATAAFAGLFISLAAPRTTEASAFVWPTSGTLSATAWYPSGAVHSGSADIANGYWTGIGASRFGNAYASYEGGGCGYYVYINHASGYQTLYCHMIQWPSVGGGQWVNTNQHIGYIGTTGHSTGPHCHFAIRRWGARLVIPGIWIGQWVNRGAGVPGTYWGL